MLDGHISGTVRIMVHVRKTWCVADFQMESQWMRVFDRMDVTFMVIYHTINIVFLIIILAW